MRQKKHQFTVILEPESDGGYSVHCPALPGCVSQGDDRKTALVNIKEAILLVLEEYENEESNALAAMVLDAINGIPFPPARADQALLNEIWEISQGQREDGLPVRMEIEQVEVNTPVSV